jgi:hypothetical protein
MPARNALIWGVACLLLVSPMRSFGRQDGAAGGKDAKDAVLKAEHDLAMAEIHVDLAALDRLYADNFTHIHSTISWSQQQSPRTVLRPAKAK